MTEEKKYKSIPLLLTLGELHAITTRCAGSSVGVKAQTVIEAEHGGQLALPELTDPVYDLQEEQGNALRRGEQVSFHSESEMVLRAREWLASYQFVSAETLDGEEPEEPEEEDPRVFDVFLALCSEAGPAGPRRLESYYRHLRDEARTAWRVFSEKEELQQPEEVEDYDSSTAYEWVAVGNHSDQAFDGTKHLRGADSLKQAKRFYTEEECWRWIKDHDALAHPERVEVTTQIKISRMGNDA